MPNIAEQAHKLYPRLKNYGFQFLDSIGSPDAGPRLLETYPADERDNPMPGKPTIQQFSQDATAQDYLGETLHILPKIDPFIGGLYQEFTQSMTSEQKAKLLEQYEYSQKNYGEERPFEQWRDVSGQDAWFRGQITGQWPEKMYTPEQLYIFQHLKDYLMHDQQ